MSGFDPQRLARLAQAMQHHVDEDRVGGVVWLLGAGDRVEVGVAGRLTRGEPTPVRRDSIFRISSMTKPIVAVAALILVEEYRLRLDDPVDALLGLRDSGEVAPSAPRPVASDCATRVSSTLAVGSTGKRWRRSGRSLWRTC